jgi:hypothetical protein
MAIFNTNKRGKSMRFHFSKKVLIVLLITILISIFSLVFLQKTVQETQTSIEGQDNTNINNLEIFARIYGYVRYFHPSDEASSMDWDQFTIYGVNRMNKVSSNEDLIETLNELFLPIAPTIQISSQQLVQAGPTEVPTNSVLTVLRHHHDKKVAKYFSERIYSLSPNSIKLFDEELNYGENTIQKKLGPVYISVPTILYTSSSGTIGTTKESAEKLKDLKTNIENYVSANLLDYDNHDVRLAAIIVAWNNFQHFYPYFDEVNVDWLGQLPLFLQEMNGVEGGEGTYVVMRKMLAGLEDGHIGYFWDINKPLLILPITLKYIEGKLVIIGSEINNILPGDILLKLDEDEALTVFQHYMEQISGSRQKKEQAASYFMITTFDKLETELTLNREGKNIKMITPYNPLPMNGNTSPYQTTNELVELEPTIYYLNPMHPFDWKDEAFISKLMRAKGIIVEMRGYTGDVSPFISRLSENNLEGPRLLELQVIRPDHDPTNPFKKERWHFEPIKPNIKAKVVFLTDANAISRAETIMGIVEHYKLGEIVGEPTAGTNGTGAELSLPGGMSLYWTGLKVIKHNGSQHHNIGNLPTIPVERTIKGVKEGRDEQLEAALKSIKGN